MQLTVEAAKPAGKPVCLCGELGGYPLATPILIGLGIDEISVSPATVHTLAGRIRLLNYEECRVFVDKLLVEAVSPEEVKRMTLHFLAERQLIDPFSESNLRPMKSEL
jgi:phosphoenolpyruvate-protein kinase (PTS system EI component)